MLLGVAAAGVGVGLLVRPSGREHGRNDGGRPVAPQTPPDPASATPEVALDVRAAPTSPAAQKSLAAFALAQAARGKDAVPGLVELLRQPDIDCGRAWDFADGQLREYPSVRAACLEALRQIDGPESTRALREWLGVTQVGGEAYLAALALSERGEKGFEPRLLDVAVEADGGLALDMVRLAGRSDPLGTARRIADRAPRGEEQRDPGVLARGLAAVPWAEAGPVARGLLEEPAVTARARLRYAQALVERPEPEALAIVRDALSRGALPADEAGEIAERAVTARAFAEDCRAAREGDAEARKRAFARAEEARRVIEAAARLGAEGTDSLLSRLEKQVERLG